MLKDMMVTVVAAELRRILLYIEGSDSSNSIVPGTI